MTENQISRDAEVIAEAGRYGQMEGEFRTAIHQATPTYDVTYQIEGCEPNTETLTPDEYRTLKRIFRNEANFRIVRREIHYPIGAIRN